MIIKQKTKYLKRKLYHPGPFIIYFNSSINDYNNILVSKMKVIADLFKEIQFLEIDWVEYNKYRVQPDENLLNKVILFYDHKLIKSLEYPDNNKLAELIINSIQLYNQKTKNQTKRIDTKPRSKTNYILEILNDTSLKKQYLNNQEWFLTAAKNYKMNKILNFQNIEEVINVLSKISYDRDNKRNSIKINVKQKSNYCNHPDFNNIKYLMKYNTRAKETICNTKKCLKKIIV